MPSLVNKRLAAQRAAVDSNFASVQGQPDNPLVHAALIGAIVQYGDALKAFLEDPDALADVLWQSVSSYFDGFLGGLNQQLQQFGTNFILDHLQDVNDFLTQLNNAKQALLNALPEFASYADLVPVAQDLTSRVTSLSQALKSPSVDKLPVIFEQLGGISDDLLQVLERTGYLTANDLSPITSKITTAEAKFYGHSGFLVG